MRLFFYNFIVESSSKLLYIGSQGALFFLILSGCSGSGGEQEKSVVDSGEVGQESGEISPEIEREISISAEFDFIDAIPTQSIENEPSNSVHSNEFSKRITLPQLGGVPVDVQPSGHVWITDFYKRVPSDTIEEALFECIGDTACIFAVDTVGTLFGLPPGTIAQYAESIDTTINQIDALTQIFSMQTGALIQETEEDFHFRSKVPDGYLACNAIPLNVSQIGDGHFAMRVSATEVTAYMYLKKGNLGESDSRAQGQAVVELVREDFYESRRAQGKCQISSEPTLIWDDAF